jgi:hypothetical protein
MSTSTIRGIGFCLILLLLVCVCHAVAQSASVTLEVSATDPDAQATLQRGETFYVRLAYQTDRPIRVRIRGRRRGTEVPTMTNPSPRTDPPSGEALVWLASDKPATVDELHVVAEDQASGKSVAEVSVPVSLEWTAVSPATIRQEADWARAMSRTQQQTISQEMRKYGEGGGFFDTLLGLVIALSLPAYIAAQIWSLRRLEGGWRKAAFVPLFIMGGALAFSLFALSRGSNLWPIWLILLAPLAAVSLAGILLLHRFSAPA